MPTTRDDTIVAVSSPPGRSARALVRLSGPATHQIVARLIDQLAAAPRTLSPAKLHLGEAHLPVLASSFTGPHSFTGQDMAELQCPGNPALLERIVRAFLDVGSRLAQPGEFTFRAFLAGKLDLTQAEGVAATIAAASDGQLRAASMLREGRLGRYAAQRVDELASSLALVEAGIDFVDQDDVVPISPGKLLERLHHTAAELRELLANSRSWSAIDAPPRVVLVGAPSTGKSTLFNALLGRQRAVISPTPGTTRDILAEALTLRAGAGRSIEIMLMDLAGLDTPRTALDEQVQAAARRAIAEADLILAVTDGDSVSQMTGVECPVLRVRTKADLLPRDQDGFRDVAVSAHRGTGLDVLCRLIVDCLGTRATSITADTLALGPRHEAALRAATSHLDAAIGLLNPQRDSHALQQIEMIAAVLRAALDELESLGGRVSPDDIIGRVFATFCVGK